MYFPLLLSLSLHVTDVFWPSPSTSPLLITYHHHQSRHRATAEATTTSKAIATMTAAVQQYEAAQKEVAGLKQRLYEQDQVCVCMRVCV